MSIELQEIAKNYNSYVNSDLFQATVVSCSPGTNIIHVAPDGEGNHDHLQAIPLSSIFSAAIGFAESVLPSIGTRVLCQGRKGKRTLMLGAIPYPENQGKIASPTLPNKAILGTKEPLFNSVHKNGYKSQLTKSVIINNNLPTDVLQGEKVISNEFGVMLGLFKLLATLKGSELAQIQCHFLDDLVRIVSHNFQHYSSLGELKVFHDGKGIHLEFGGTHIPSESLGQSSDEANPSGITQINQDEGFDQFYKLSDKQLILLERMKMFVGQLGQFVNLLIVNPSQEQHALNGEALKTPDTGLLQIKASIDGTLIVRSVNGIYLEKTNWIRVPQRVRSPEDPLGDDGTTIEYPDKSAYEFDDTYRYRETAFLYYLQLRDYLAYINEEVGYANFNAHTKDFVVNSDKSKEKPLESITFIDKETGIAYKQTKSWISLMGNGGISLADAWGSCISMEGGNIYIQPAKDLVVQPNRNLIAKVGDNIAIATKGEIDLSSTSGGMRVKTKNAQYLYSTQGGIVLHSDGQNFKDSTVTIDGDPDSMVTNVAGIVFNAPNSSVNSYAPQIFSNSTQSYVVKGSQITLDSKLITRIMSDEELILRANDLFLISDTSTVSYSTGNNTTMGLGSTIVGLKGQTFGVASIFGGQAPVQGFLDQNNNSEKAFFDSLNTLVSDLDTFDITTELVVFKDDTDFTDLKFQFPPSILYNLNDSEDIIPETLSQQTDTLSGVYALQNWVEESINSSYPYPGSDFNMSLARVDVNNIDVDKTDNVVLANKAVGLLNKSKVVIDDIFKHYKSM